MAPAYLGDALAIIKLFGRQRLRLFRSSSNSSLAVLLMLSTIYIGEATDRCPSLEQKLGTAVRCDVTKVSIRSLRLNINLQTSSVFRVSHS